MADTVTLQPVAMVRPNRAFIYAPSRLRPVKQVSHAEFLERYADHSRIIQVSFGEDGVSNPQSVMAYGFGLDCWYIMI